MNICRRIYLLALLLPRCGVDGFASYLLTKTNCLIELDTEEVIMNSLVVAADASDDPDMKIQVVGHTAVTTGTTTTDEDSSISIQVPPGKVSLQVLTSNPDTDADYQYVMDVLTTGGGDGGASAASFENGSCDNKKRVAGRGKEIVELILGAGETAHVTAGWAAGHEAVRLTPAVTLKGTISASDGQEEKKKGEMKDPLIIEDLKVELERKMLDVEKLKEQLVLDNPAANVQDTEKKTDHKNTAESNDESAPKLKKIAEAESRRRHKEVHVEKEAARRGHHHDNGHHRHEEGADPVEAMRREALKEHIQKIDVFDSDLGSKDEVPRHRHPRRRDDLDDHKPRQKTTTEEEEETAKNRHAEAATGKHRERLREAQGVPRLTFATTWTSYFMGMVILVGATGSAIKLFLTLSHRHKGL